jgi:hypothetical protein
VSAAPRVRADAVFREVGEEWVVYDPRARQLHALNLTAALVWTFCDGEAEVDEIVGKVRSALATAPDEAAVRSDVDRVLHDFREAGLLE